MQRGPTLPLSSGDPSTRQRAGSWTRPRRSAGRSSGSSIRSALWCTTTPPGCSASSSSAGSPTRWTPQTALPSAGSAIPATRSSTTTLRALATWRWPAGAVPPRASGECCGCSITTLQPAPRVTSAATARQRTRTHYSISSSSSSLRSLVAAVAFFSCSFSTTRWTCTSTEQCSASSTGWCSTRARQTPPPTWSSTPSCSTATLIAAR
mmetsp:Transcript_13797/g.54566  ORF Transcript_13797/g.54566 Transcript_13797/m.54566 type:complete len:208 (+) Transcript_13797:231-854(+)